MNKFRRKIERLIFVPYFLFKVTFIYKSKDIKRKTLRDIILLN